MQKEFLQSEQWRKFQEAFGRRTFSISSESFSASIIEHDLPIVGKYFYIPRGPIISEQELANSDQGIKELVDLAKKERASWVRFDPENEDALEIIKNAVGADLASAQKGQAQGLSLQKYKIVKAPHDMQPKQIFIIDITGTEEEILAKMKSKTRYNIRLAEKKGVSIRITNRYEYTNGNMKDFDEFLRLTKVMAKRQGITPHPDEYYRKMLEIIPEEMLQLYVAEYDGKVVAANLMVFYGDTTIYLHGASDDEYRNVMAPYLLQWRAIREAKKRGCTKYDFGGIKTPTSPSSPLLGKGEGRKNLLLDKEKVSRLAGSDKVGGWAGITRFKLGFAPDTMPTEFPGSYDIVISSTRYWLYRSIQKIKSII